MEWMNQLANVVKKMVNPFLSSYLFIALVILSFSSCKYSEEYQAVNANNEFSVSLPSWLKEEDGLKPGATLQYANRYRNFYIIGHTDPIGDKDIHQVTSSYLNVLRQSMKDAVVTDSVETNIQQHKAIRTEVYGKMNGEHIYFSEVVIKGKNKFYHLSVWTRGEDRKLRYKAEIERILNSFREI